MTQVQGTGRPHAGKNAFRKHVGKGFRRRTRKAPPEAD
ncbi:hypothetical protein F504_1168 [Ralstonia pseudosolanacearum FQY_4]|nr:hypothetical protein F504_1168 [Ralstonia pseudosolanacearum FQY_4]